MGPRESRGMKSRDSKKSKLAKSQKTKEATSEVVDITKSEGEEVDPSSKQTQDKETSATARSEDDLSSIVKLKRVHLTSGGVDTPHQGHQYITDEETRTTPTALELLQETEDPVATDGTQTSPHEAAHFEGTGLMDNIRSSLKKKKGTHSHHTMQQVTVDTPASSITALPIQHIPQAKVIAEDLINLQSRPGSPNTLVMAASELTSSRGRGGRSGKREPRPPTESRALTDITRSTGSGSGVAARKDGEEDNPEPRISQLTAIISQESDFAADQHQMIPTDKCFGLPVVPRQSGGFKLNYKDAVEVTNF